MPALEALPGWLRQVLQGILVVVGITALAAVFSTDSFTLRRLVTVALIYVAVVVVLTVAERVWRAVAGDDRDLRS